MIVLQKLGKVDYTLPENYCPIALLECLGKALERIITTKLTRVTEIHKLLLEYQIGARRQRSTLIVLELLIEQTYTIWNYRN